MGYLQFLPAFSIPDMHVFGTWISLLLGITTAHSTPVNVLLVVLGMAAIAKGGDLFTDSAVAIARATRIPPAIIGATIVSLATTFPEFVVSVTGVLRGSAGLSVGNALGSCCCNIGLIVGSCAVFSGLLAYFRGSQAGISASRQGIAGPVLFMLAGGVALWAFSVFDNPLLSSPYGLAAWEGLALVSILAGYLGYSTWTALRARYASGPPFEERADRDEGRGISRREIALFLVGAGLVLFGSRQLVMSASQIARTFHVSELAIGLTILAIGTSLPEYTVALMSIIKGHSGLGIGNIIGANILNICGVVATCALISPLPIERRTVMFDVPVVLVLMLLLVLFSWKHGRVSAWGGVALVCVYTGYMLLL